MPYACQMVFKLVYRTYGIGGRGKKLGIFLLTFWFACTASEWFMGLYGREFLQDENVQTFITYPERTDQHSIFYQMKYVERSRDTRS